MSFAATFGSVGDFISICQIAIQLSKALGDGYGSSSTEYQDLRKELDTFAQVVTYIESSRRQLESHSTNPHLLGLCKMIGSVTDQCGSLIKGYLDRVVPKYSDVLRSGKPQFALKAASKKVEWAVSERQQVQTLQAKLRSATATLIVLVGLATQQVTRLEHEAMTIKVDQVLEQQDQAQKTMVAHATALEKLSQQQHQQLSTLDERVELSVGQNSQAINLANDLLRKLVEDVQHVRYHMSNPPPPGALDPTKNLPVLLEDPLGYCLTVPMEWIKSWEVSKSMAPSAPLYRHGCRASIVYYNSDLRTLGKVRSWFEGSNLHSRTILPVKILIDWRQYRFRSVQE
ncbi:hypothetical protein B0T16DRAFT_414687 [Cercophora newfieldiana]|uniref:Fungal N-terminal domain-containing protein n=1 Tax=Cercophora newfieldiana TaxID=92897 RepID=A0AA40CQM6_9PEZI|nr:hypothetical protein B0T16DRAFT_414687 [Cercophora newfieldiana]